ncbi:MAG: enhanced serine sensitivity protein SseB C-terminal domain-containing protein [Planctomycetes bacterium]|nr:enhanced serine sensitivity protein SseB C-terminal domain-containing protein [Planctomycetota bacterium]
MASGPVNELERLLVQALRSPASRPQFYQEFLRSNVFVIRTGPPPAETRCRVAGEGETLSVHSWQAEGRTVIPIFSSLPRLQAFITEDVGYVSLSAEEFLRMTLGSVLLLNPGTEYEKEFTPQEAAALLEGAADTRPETFTIPEGADVILGMPKDYPHELADALGRFFRTQRNVKRAYLAQILVIGRDERPHTLIGLEAGGDWQQVVAAAVAAIRGVHVPSPPVDFLPITGRGGTEEYFREKCKPFYQRKLLGVF